MPRTPLDLKSRLAVEPLDGEVVLPPKRSLARKVEDLYVESAGVAFLFLSWCYVSSHGLDDFVMGGDVRVFFRALAWPYFAFFC